MPFKSKVQARYMFARHPRLAKEFASKTKSIKRLPERTYKHGSGILSGNEVLKKVGAL